jgi:uncharacterized protein YuzE
MTDYAITEHARFEMQRRGVTEEMVQSVLRFPEQTVQVRPGRILLQSRILLGEPAKAYLLRVIVDVDRSPAEIVTVYRTSKLFQILEATAVKVNYDPRTDTLSILLKENAAVAESDEEKPGVILDYDELGDLVSMEILDASRRVTEAQKVEFQIAK